jgi:hypothetical protein
MRKMGGGGGMSRIFLSIFFFRFFFQ